VLRAIVPYSALEAFEADTQSRLFYRVSNLQGQLDLRLCTSMPFWRGKHRRDRPPYAALVDFYDDTLSRASRCAWRCCCSRWRAHNGRGMAVVQVAETLELRRNAGAPAPASTRSGSSCRAGGGDRAGGHRAGRAAGDAAGAAAERGSSRPGPPKATSRRSPAADAPRASCCRMVDATTRGDDPAVSACWRTRSASCATPRTSCARRWRCSRRRCSRRCAATCRAAPGAATRSTTRWSARRCWRTRCCRSPRWSSCGSSPTRRSRWSSARRCARWSHWSVAPLLADKAHRVRALGRRQRLAHRGDTNGCCASWPATCCTTRSGTRRHGGALAVRVLADGDTAALGSAATADPASPPSLRPAPVRSPSAAGDLRQRLRPRAWRSAARSCVALGRARYSSKTVKRTGGRHVGLDAVVRLPLARDTRS
jgi:hypothetical protein